jgi:hypothetical protein
MKERKLWKKKVSDTFIDLAELGCSAIEVPHLRMETSSFHNMFCSEYQTRGKVRKTSNPKCNLIFNIFET